MHERRIISSGNVLPSWLVQVCAIVCGDVSTDGHLSLILLQTLLEMVINDDPIRKQHTDSVEGLSNEGAIIFR